MRKQRFILRGKVGKVGRRVVAVKAWMIMVISTVIGNAVVFPAYADGLTVTDTAIKIGRASCRERVSA